MTARLERGCSGFSMIESARPSASTPAELREQLLPGGQQSLQAMEPRSMNINQLILELRHQIRRFRTDFSGDPTSQKRPHHVHDLKLTRIRLEHLFTLIQVLAHTQNHRLRRLFRFPRTL